MTKQSSLAGEPAWEREPDPRARIGCIQLPTDLTLDEEGPALVARVPGVRLRLQKLALDGDTLDFENYASARGRIQQAAATLRPARSLDVLGLACTSLAFALGRKEVQKELREAHPGAQVTDMASAMLAACAHLGVSRPALLTPYGPELHERNLDLLRSQGIETVAHRHLDLRTDEEISAIAEERLVDLARSVDAPDGDSVVIACSAFRVLRPGFLDQLESLLGKPVISSQQAFLWHLLRLAEVNDSMGGYGKLFAPSGEPHSLRLPKAEVLDREQDVYPSRVPDPKWIDRIDPVVDPKTRSLGPLSDAQVERFERRGALVLPQVFTPSEVQHLRATTDALREHYESKTYEELDRSTDMRVITERGGSLVEEDGAPPTLKSIWQIHLPAEDAEHMLFAGDLTRRTVCDARLVRAAQQLLGEDVYIHQSRINFQRGLGQHHRGGSGFLWHQDFEQWHSEDGMPRMRALSMAILLERAVPANGALMVMPGSHRRMLQAFGDPKETQRYAQGALSRGPVLPAQALLELADTHGIEYCQGEPGDVVLFDCNTVHGSHTNISPWGRAMFFAVYNAVSNLPAKRPFAAGQPRPEHIGSRDPRYAGVALPALTQALVAPLGSQDQHSNGVGLAP